MIKIKIEIKNYESIKELKTEFKKGITLITGKTNTGKSALIRAIQDFYSNSATESEINNEETNMLIKIDGNQFSRNKTSKQYILDGKEFNTPGRGQFEELKKIGLGDVNFQNQQSAPFLLFETPSNKYKYIIGEKDNKLIEVSDKMKEDLNSLKSINKVKTKELTQKENKSNIIKEELKEQNYYELKELDKKIDILLEQKKNIENINDKIISIETKEKDFNNMKIINKNQLDEIKNKIEHFEKLKRLKIQKDKISKITQELNNIETIEEDRLFEIKQLIIKKEIIKKIKELEEKELIYNNIKQLDTDICNNIKETIYKKENIQKINKKVYEYKKVKKELTNIFEKISILKKQEEEIRHILKICPLCGGGLE